jgi:hypothetical protein
MSLSETEQNLILRSFPKLELSYETIIHKKVYNSEIILAIPDGRKCFAWFTSYKTQNVCVLLEISENKQIQRMRIVNACFHDHLSYGTIFYGTTFKYKNANYFCTEDIYYYKGKDVSKSQFSEKLTMFKIIYSSEIRQRNYCNNSIIFGLPIMNQMFQTIVGAIELLPYRIKYIQFRDSELKICNLPFTRDNAHTPILHSNPTNQKNNTSGNYNVKREVVFKVKPDIQNDIYHLHYYDNNGSDNIYDVAYIPDYKTSVMMNRLFRKIKENQNLDALEESDDEEEFENNSPDKFVFLDKTYNMVCVFNNKFKKWVPIRVSQKGEKIVKKRELVFYDR